MKAFLETCLEEANNFKETKMDVVEERIEKWSKVLHKNHFLIGILKKRLFDLYKLFPPPEEEVELKPYLQVKMHILSSFFKNWKFLEFAQGNSNFYKP